MRLLVLVTLLFCANVSVADNTKTIHAELKKILADEDNPGFQYIVLNQSGIIFQFNAGYRNLGEKQLVSSNTMFMLNSSSKVFTAAAIMQLVDVGKINITDKLDQYVNFHPYGANVTIQHLLNQTSGIPNPLPINWLHVEEDHHQFNEHNLLSSVMEEEPELSFEPGKKYAYSNISYWLLGKVVENVSGMSYCQYLQTRIFDPLEIKPEELSCSLPSKSTYAFGYQKKYSLLSLFFYVVGADRFFENTEDGFIRYKRIYHNGPSYGGLFGTGNGVAKFLHDMLKERPTIFGQKTKQLFFSKQKNNSGQFISMTLGWRVGEAHGRVFYEKPGGGPGSHSNLRIYPGDNLATLFFVNRTNVNENSISDFSSKLDAHILDAGAVKWENNKKIE